MRALRISLLLTSSLAIVSCDDKPKPPPAPVQAPASPASVAAAIGLDASILETADPPPPPGDLRADLERFVNVDQCVAERAKLDPLLGDALRAIGYDTFIRDACRLLEAAKDKKGETCDKVDSSALRTRCRSWVAIVAQTPEACPMVMEGAPPRGRWPSCLAIAGKDPRLCAGEARTTPRATCDALVNRDESRCDPLLPGDRAACKREVARWRTSLAAPLDGLPKLPTPRGKLTVRGADGTMDPPNPETDLAADLARGAVVVTSGIAPAGDREARRARVELGALENEFVRVGGSPNRRMSVGIAVVVEPPALGTRETRLVLERLDLEIPGEPPMVYPGARCDCTVKTARIDNARGGEVEIALTGTVSVGTRTYKIDVTAATFARDVITDQAGAGRVLPPLHPSLPSGGAIDAGP